MNKKRHQQKIGMAMTQAFNDMNYNDEIPLEMRQISTVSETKRLKAEIQDLKRTVQINKEIINSLISENNDLNTKWKLLEKENKTISEAVKRQEEEISHLNDKCLILDQIKTFHESAAEEMELIWNEKISEYKEQLDRKEYVIQTKEKKWNEIEKIMTIYSKSDPILREHLTQLKYLWDDTSAGRGISSVIKENEILKNKLRVSKNEIDSLVALIHELQKTHDDPSLDEIMEEVSSISGGTGSVHATGMHPSIPMLDINAVNSKKKDTTNYKQLFVDQSKYVKELEVINYELKRKWNKLVSYVKNKTMKYKLNAKDSMKRLKVVKKKLEEYDGLNVSVFETIENHEKIMSLRDVSQTNDQNSIFSHEDDVSPIAIDGIPRPNKLPSFSNDEEIFAATGSSSQHRRAKSKPYMYKQHSDIRKQQLMKLEKDLAKLNSRSPSFWKAASDVTAFKTKSGRLDSRLSNQLMRGAPSDISDIRFPSERAWESPINAKDIFDGSFNA